MKPETLGRDAVSITLVVIMLTLVLAFISIPVTSAEVKELNVDPQVVDPGDVITITGNATPWEEVWISSSFELPLDVKDGEYSDAFNNIHFPPAGVEEIIKKKKFSVRAENIKNITVSLSPIGWWTITITCSGQTKTFSFMGITETCPINDINETGIVEFSVPSPTQGIDIRGKKNVKVEGVAAVGATSVNLKVAISIKVIADSKGDFAPPEINTEGIPEGEFLITAGEIEKTVYIGVTPTPTPSPSPSPSPSPTPTPTSSSSNGDDGNGAPDTTLSPTPSPSTSPSPTPTATSTPTATLAPTATPAVTSPTPAPTTPSPSPSPTPSQRWIPGFEAVFAIAGLLAVAYLALRKRRK